MSTKTAEEIAQYIRHRQNEMADMAPDDRRERLAIEVEELWTGVPSSNKRFMVDQIERLFPTGLTDEFAVAPAALARSPKPKLEELVVALNEAVAERPVSERPAVRAALVKSLGLETVLPAKPSLPALPSKPDLNQLLMALNEQIAARPARERAAMRTEIANGLGLHGTLTVRDLTEALERFKETALSDPDPVLNEHRASFKQQDIINLRSLAVKLSRPEDGVSEFLCGRFSLEANELLSRFRMTKSERGLGDALEQELAQIVSGDCIYDEQRFAGVTLSDESRHLLRVCAEIKPPDRLNQALLEDAYPTEIRCLTTEREFIENLTGQLSNLATQPLSAEKVVNLAAALLVELGCLEQFGRIILVGLNRTVFDPVNGRIELGEHNEMSGMITRAIESNADESILKDVRNFTGLIKSLLYWYGYACGLSPKLLFDLDPIRIEQQATNTTRFTRRTVVEHEKAWEFYRGAFKEALLELCGPERVIEGKLTEDELRGPINNIIERKVTTLLAEKYPEGWHVRD